jgi:uncharacterized membrane protein
MPDAGNIPDAATELVRKAKPAADHPKGLAAAGAALIALPYAAQGIAKLTGRSGGATESMGAVGDKVKEKTVGKAGEAKEKTVGKAKEKTVGKAKEAAEDVGTDAVKSKMPKGLGGLFGGLFGGGDSDGEGSDGEGSDASAAPGFGSGRRMPIQQSVDVAVPVEFAYNLWTQFEDWPRFMHRVDSAQQVDETTVSFNVKVWGIGKQFEAEILEQHPDERIEWDVSQGLAHTGVVTFHELAPRLTRVDVSVDVNPDSLLEKMGRGMRFSKRAVRGDLHRFKAYAEISADEDDVEGWRGTISDGEVQQKKSRRKSGGSNSNGSSKRRSSGKSSNGSSPSSRSSSKAGSRS